MNPIDQIPTAGKVRGRPARWLQRVAIGAFVLGGVVLSAAASESAPVVPLLPAYSVGPEFTLEAVGPRAGGGLKFVSVDDQPRSRSRGRVKFRSASLRSGDELMSVAGRPVATMTPAERLAVLNAVPLNVRIDLEVRQPNARTGRPVAAVRVFHPEEKFASDAAIREFAELARPACVFDECGTVIFDAGAKSIVAAIAVEPGAKSVGDRMDENLPRRIVVRTSRPLARAPRLAPADNYQVAIRTERMSELEWAYALDFGGEPAGSHFVMCRFVLAID